MKGNIKKLSVFVIIAAIAMFSTAAMAWDDEHNWNKGIQGKYAFIGSGACLMAAGGFTDDTHFTPQDPTHSSIGPNTWEGLYTFNYNGTGSIDAINRYMDTTISAGSGHIYWEFTYSVQGGKITFTYKPGTYVATYLYGPQAGFTLSNVTFGSWDGRISPDGESLFVSFGVPMKLIPPFPGLEIVCNGVHQGFRIFE